MITVETYVERNNVFCKHGIEFMPTYKALNYMVCNKLQWKRRVIEFSPEEIILEVNTVLFNQKTVFKGSKKEMAPLTLTIYAYLLICEQNYVIEGAIKNGFEIKDIPALGMAKPILFGSEYINKDDKKQIKQENHYGKDQIKIPFIIGLGAVTRKEAGRAFRLSVNDLSVISFLLDEDPNKTFSEIMQEF